MFLLAPASLAAGQPANPAALVAAAAGHPSQRHLLAQATSIRAGEHVTATLELAGPRRLETVCADDLCSGTWFDGQQRWTFGINGTPLPERDADNARERTFAAIASTGFAEPAFLSAGGTVAALPAAGGGGQRFRVIAPHGGELVAVADPRTHRLGEVDTPDGSVFHHLVPTISGTTIVYGPRPYDRIETIDTPLTAPSGPRVTVGGEAEIPLVSASLPIVPCSLAGLAASCLIDTGTTPSAVTLDFAEKLNLEPHGSIEIAGLDGYLTGVVESGPLVVGRVSIDPLRFAVIPRAHGAAFDVVLGCDALQGLAIGFDAQRHRANISASAPQTGAGPIAVDFSGGVPFTRVRLNGRERSEAMLVDTGDMGQLSIGYDEYREDTALFAVSGSGAAIGPSGAARDTLRGELAQADIGGQPLDNVAIQAVRGQHIGHIGYGFAARCNPFIIDLGQRRIECGVQSGPSKPSAPG